MTALQVTEIPQKPTTAALWMTAFSHTTAFLFGALAAFCMVWMWAQ